MNKDFITNINDNSKNIINNNTSNKNSNSWFEPFNLNANNSITVNTASNNNKNNYSSLKKRNERNSEMNK